MLTLRQAAVVGSLLFAAACTHAHGSDTAFNDLHMNGRWAVACHKVTGDHVRYVTESMAFDKAGRFVREIKDYTKPGCPTDALFDARAYAGTYKLAGASQESPGAYDVDFTLSRALATAYGPEAVEAFNKAKKCNHVDWKRGERRSVMGADCAGETLALGTVVYDLVQPSGDHLYFGETSYFRDGSAPDKRPTRIDQGLAFNRAKKAPVAH